MQGCPPSRKRPSRARRPGPARRSHAEPPASLEHRRADRRSGRGAPRVHAETGLPGRRSGGRPLGELLVTQHLIDSSQLAAALVRQAKSPDKRLGALLVEAGALDERSLAPALSAQLGVPLADLSQQRPEEEAIGLLTETVARAHLAIPLRVDEDGGLVIVVADPSEELRRVLADASGRRVDPADCQRVGHSAHDRQFVPLGRHDRPFRQGLRAGRGEPAGGRGRGDRPR